MLVLSALYQKSVMSFFKPVSHSYYSALPDNRETCLLVQACQSLGYFLGHQDIGPCQQHLKIHPSVEIPPINMTSRPFPPFPALEIHKGKLSVAGKKVKQQKRKKLGSW